MAGEARHTCDRRGPCCWIEQSFPDHRVHRIAIVSSASGVAWSGWLTRGSLGARATCARLIDMLVEGQKQAAGTETLSSPLSVGSSATSPSSMRIVSRYTSPIGESDPLHDVEKATTKPPAATSLAVAS
ncbi:hypothetical protein PSPO01_14040 [Paraphaeosphaeria sporulosa]